MSIQALFSAIDQFRGELREQLGQDDADARLALVRELIVRLPHRFLPATTKEEIQDAGRQMMAAGRTGEEMRNLQATLVGLLDRAFKSKALPFHPLRNLGDATARSQEAPPGALVVGLEPAQTTTVSELLGPSGTEVHRVPSVLGALDRARWFPFTFVLSHYQTIGDQVPEFLAALRAPDSLCCNSGIMLLAPNDALGQAQDYAGAGANRVLDLGNLDLELPPAIAELGAVSEREDVRLMVRATVGGGKRTEVWQSENLSASGTLVRAQTTLATGDELELSFQLPGDVRQIVVRGEVARRTRVGAGRAQALGLRFLDFQDDGQARLEAFLKRQTRSTAR